MRYHIVKLQLICTCNWWTHILLETLRIYEQSCWKGGPVKWYDLYKSCNWWNSISFETLRICEQSYWEEGPGKWYMYDSYESSLYITQTYHIHHLNQSHNVTTHIETPFSLAFTLSWQMFPACLTTGNNYLILHSTNSRYLFSLLLGDHLSIEEKRCASQMTSSMWWKNNVICSTTKNEKSANTGHFWMHLLDHVFGLYYLWLWKIPWNYHIIAHILGNFHFRLFIIIAFV